MKWALTIGGFVVACVLALGAWYVYLHAARQGASSIDTVQTIYTNTLAGNPSFSSGAQLVNTDQYERAIPELQNAVAQAPNKDAKIMALFYLASAYGSSGKYTEGIDTLRQIASLSNARPVQALAVEKMAQLYQTHPSASTTAALFSGVPYNSFYATSSVNRSVRNVLKYAVSLYPLPISEYGIAGSYANAILYEGLQTKQDAATRASFARVMQSLKASFQAGDLMATSSAIATFTYPSYRSEALLERATVLGKLQQIGDTSLGDADQAFKVALESTQASGSSDSVARMRYAMYLNTVYGASRATDIQTLLTPIYQTPSAVAYSFLRQYVGVKNSQTKASLVSLAGADPQFKTYLDTIGWTDADFK